MITQLTFFCELDDSELLKLLCDGKTIPLLQALHARVSLALETFTTIRAECVRLLNHAEIPVVAWLLLPKNKGYWLNSTTLDMYLRRYTDFAAWVTSQEISFIAVGWDVEPLYQEMEILCYKPWKFLPQAIKRLRTYNRTELALKMKALVKSIHEDGFETEAYIWPIILDEWEIGSEFLTRFFGLIDLPLVKTHVPMVYQSFIPFSLGKGLLKTYLRDGYHSIAIGSTGGGVTIGNLHKKRLNLVQLYDNLGMVSSYNGRAWIFSLEGCVQDDGFLWHLAHSDFGCWSDSRNPRVASFLRGVLQLFLLVTRLFVG